MVGERWIEAERKEISGRERRTYNNQAEHKVRKV